MTDPDRKEQENRILAHLRGLCAGGISTIRKDSVTVSVLMFYRYVSETMTAYHNNRLSGDYAQMPDEEAKVLREATMRERGVFLLPSQLFGNVLRNAGGNSELAENLGETLRQLASPDGEGRERSDVPELFQELNVNSGRYRMTVARRNRTLAMLLEVMTERRLFCEISVGLLDWVRSSLFSLLGKSEGLRNRKLARLLKLVADMDMGRITP